MADDRQGLVVAGIDGSDFSAEVLRWAVAEAECRHAALEVVHVVAPLPSGKVSSPRTPPDVMAQHESLIRACIADALGPEAAEQVNAQFVWGDAAKVLVMAAETADLLVVGSRGHGAIVGMLIGSVSLHCVSHAECPVVVVRPDGGTTADAQTSGAAS